MKRMFIGAVAFFAFSAAAMASCPYGTRYVCSQGYGGKVVCSCQ